MPLLYMLKIKNPTPNFHELYLLMFIGDGSIVCIIRFLPGRPLCQLFPQPLQPTIDLRKVQKFQANFPQLIADFLLYNVLHNIELQDVAVQSIVILAIVLLSHRQLFVICNWSLNSAVAWTEPQLRSRASREQRKRLYAFRMNEFHQCRCEIRDQTNLQFFFSLHFRYWETPVTVNFEGKIRPLCSIPDL